MSEPLPESKYELFLEMLGICGIPNQACELAGVHRSTMFKRKKEDELFAARWEDARRQAVEVLEAEARRRAIDGIDKPYYYKGKVVGVLKERSDRLLEFMLAGMAPKKYGKQQTGKLELTGAEGKPLIPEEISDIAVARRVAWLLTQSQRQEEVMQGDDAKLINPQPEESS